MPCALGQGQGRRAPPSIAGGGKCARTPRSATRWLAPIPSADDRYRATFRLPASALECLAKGRDWECVTTVPTQGGAMLYER